MLFSVLVFRSLGVPIEFPVSVIPVETWVSPILGDEATSPMRPLPPTGNAGGRRLGIVLAPIDSSRRLGHAVSGKIHQVMKTRLMSLDQ